MRDCPPGSKTDSTCRWRRRKEDRPSEILAAALKIFAEKGFAATKLDDIAKEAGVSKGTLYLYFESKEFLFKSLINEFVLPQISRAQELANDHKGPVKEFLQELAKQWWLSVGMTDLSGIPKLMITEAANFPELAKFYQENVIQPGRQIITKLIELGISRNEFRQCNAAEVARHFMGPLVFAAIWQRSLAPFDESYDVDNYINTHLEIFMRGLSKDDT